MTSLLPSMIKFYPILLFSMRFPESAWVYWNINPLVQMLSIQNLCQNVSLAPGFILLYFQLVISGGTNGINFKGRKKWNI